MNKDKLLSIFILIMSFDCIILSCACYSFKQKADLAAEQLHMVIEQRNALQEKLGTH